MRRLLAASLTWCLLALAVMAGSATPAHAVAAGSGVRGTLVTQWGGVSGEPITTWNGRATFVFDPSAAARQSTLAAVPEFGWAYQPLHPPHVQAVRVTSLVGDKAQTVSCSEYAEDGTLVDRQITATSAIDGIVDGRVAFTIGRVRLDLLTGTGYVELFPTQQMHHDGWWVRDRFALPGRYSSSGTWPCPGPTDGPVEAPRILMAHGGGAVPRPISDFMYDYPTFGWPVRRTDTGRWRVAMDLSRRVTFSESPFGPQDRQQLYVKATSNMYLAGTLLQLGARCKVPHQKMGRAKTARAAVSLARRAGLPKATYGGLRYTGHPVRNRFQIRGRLLDTQGGAPCRRGTYVVYQYRQR